MINQFSCFEGRRGAALSALLAFLLHVLPLRTAKAEDRLDLKTMYYMESQDRVRVLAPTFLYEHATDSGLTIRLEGIYNTISGATPTGAPRGTFTAAAAAPSTPGGTISGASPGTVPGITTGASPTVAGTAPTSGASPTTGGTIPTSGASPTSGGDDDDDDDDERDDDHRLARYAGASPLAQTPGTTPATSSGQGGVPMVDVEETRFGMSLEAIKRFGPHTASAQLSFSTESDYESYGIALRDAIDLNRKNTTVLLGSAYTHDVISAPTLAQEEDKNTVDLILGVTQLLGPKALLTVNLSLSRADGYLSDPYKIVELNGVLVPERRPDSKDKTIAYISLARYFSLLRGATELSYRWYDDSFGVTAHTYGLAWHQRLGDRLVISPSVRLYEQDAADFYDVRFAGEPEFYSSDYRLSESRALGYGLKIVWMPTDRFSVDLAYERYEQEGKDGKTDAAMYPTADVIMAGARIWF